MTALILEDDIRQLNALEQLITTNFKNITILKATNYELACKLAEKHSVSFFLLDIELDTTDSNALTGIDFGNFLRSKEEYRYVPILYITSIPNQIQSAVNSIHCQNYLLKPYTSEELLNALHFLLQMPSMKNSPLHICDRNGIYYKIKEKNILFIEASGKSMTIYYAEGNHITKIFTSKYRLNDLAEILSEDFLQCHKKYLINRNQISSYDKTTAIVCIVNYHLPVGRKYKATLEHFVL